MVWQRWKMPLIYPQTQSSLCSRCATTAFREICLVWDTAAPAEDGPSITSNPCPSHLHPLSQAGGTGAPASSVLVSLTPDPWSWLSWGSCRAGTESWGHSRCWGIPGAPAELRSKAQPQHTLPGRQHLSAGRTGGPAASILRALSQSLLLSITPCSTDHALACLHFGISPSVKTAGEGFCSCCAW